MTEKEQNTFKTREIKIEKFCSGVVVHSFNLSTQEIEAGRALRAGDQPGLSNEFQAHQGIQGETLSIKQKEQNKQASDPP